MRTRVHLFIVALAGCTSASNAPADPAPAPAPAPTLPALGMSDVSVLLPLPSSSDAGYLRPTSAGERGELLPKTVFDAIPTFPVKPTDGLDYARMRTVAIRFDGCFPAPAGCEPQIRMVMQPVTTKGDALDSALHLFYRLTEAELGEVVAGLRHLRTLAPEVADAPLDVHAGVVAQGMEGPYGQALDELLLKYAGEQNLVRMTFFLRAPPTNEVWFFGGFDRVDGKTNQLDIVGVGKANQRVMLDTTTSGGFAFDLLPVETTPEDTSLFLTSEKIGSSSTDDLAKTLAAYRRIENPHKYGPDQLPCAGCHIATSVTEHASAKLGAAMPPLPDAFTSARDLTLTGDATKNVSSLRAFGWFKKRPMIARRVVNETAQILDDLEARFPATPATK